MRPARRVLFIHTRGGIGDLLLSSPIAQAIATSWQGVSITAWVAPPFRTLLDGNPWFADCLALDPAAGFGVQLGEIRRRRFDAAVHAWTTGREAALSWLARIPIRAGQSGRLAYSWTFTHPVDIASARGDTTTHWMDIQLEYARVLGCGTGGARPVLRLAEREVGEARQRLAAHGVSGRPGACALHVGKGLAGGITADRWPLARFVDAGKRLVEAGRPVVLVGSTAEHEAAAHVAREIGAGAVAVTSATARDLAAVVANMSVVISPDSGPGHLAAALGVPVVAIFAVRSDVVARWRPQTPQHRVVTTAPWVCPKSECVKERCARFDCLEAFDAAEVARAALELAREFDRVPDAVN